MALVRVLLEPVRSAEPPTISGTAGTEALQRELARPCGWRCPSASAASFSLTARDGGVRARAGRSPRMRRSNSARLRPAAPRARLSQALRARLASAGRRRARRSRTSAGIERRVAPAELLARALDLVGAERRAVRRCLAGLGRRAEADGGPAGDQRRPVGRLRLLDRGGDRLRIVAVDARRVPAGGLEALHLIDRVRQRQRRRRSRCRCRRTARSACRACRCPASAIASWLMPSIRSPSEAST